MCTDPAGKAPVADLSTNQGPLFQARIVPFRVDEDRTGGSAITERNSIAPERGPPHLQAVAAIINTSGGWFAIEYSHCPLVKQGGALCSPRHMLQLIGQSVPKRQRSEARMALDRGVGS